MREATLELVKANTVEQTEADVQQETDKASNIDRELATIMGEYCVRFYEHLLQPQEDEDAKPIRKRQQVRSKFYKTVDEALEMMRHWESTAEIPDEIAAKLEYVEKSKMKSEDLSDRRLKQIAIKFADRRHTERRRAPRKVEHEGILHKLHLGSFMMGCTLVPTRDNRWDCSRTVQEVTAFLTMGSVCMQNQEE